MFTAELELEPGVSSLQSSDLGQHRATLGAGLDDL